MAKAAHTVTGVFDSGRDVNQQITDFEEACRQYATQSFIKGLYLWLTFEERTKDMDWLNASFQREKVTLTFYTAIGMSGLDWKDEYNSVFEKLGR